MGRLAGFKYREVIKKLRKLSWELSKQARGSHEIWHHPVSRLRTTIPNHPGDMPEGTLRAILQQGQIDVDDFLQA